jgi:hypothetical protein
MLNELINWSLVKDLNESSDKLENLFKNSEVLAKYKTETQTGVIFKLKDEKIVMVYSDNKELVEEDINEIVKNSIIFPLLSDAMNYLRDVRFDHVINYDIRNLTEPLLGELYKNKKVEIKDILGV